MNAQDAAEAEAWIAVQAWDDSDDECPDAWHAMEGGEQWCPTCGWCEMHGDYLPHCDCGDVS